MIVATSTVDDGSMKSSDKNFETVLPTRTAFLAKHGIDADDTTLVHLTYETTDFCRYITADDSLKGDGITRQPSIEADAIATTSSGHALFLPLADCIAAVVHDPTLGVLMVSHLGRHNLEQTGGTKSINYLANNHGCDPKNLTVWLSPAAGKGNYPLFGFDNRSLHDVAMEQLRAAGVPSANITASPIDTTTNAEYFSHSQFLAGNRPTDGRHAVVAVMG